MEQVEVISDNVSIMYEFNDIDGIIGSRLYKKMRKIVNELNNCKDYFELISVLKKIKPSDDYNFIRIKIEKDNFFFNYSKLVNYNDYEEYEDEEI